MSLVAYRELDGGVGLIEIRRPEVHNALNRVAQQEFDECLAAANANASIGAVVLAGAGGKALSAGWDIEEMRSLSRDDNVALLLEREEWLWRWYTSPTPTVAAMQGLAYGVGALLAACADLRVGGPGTRFKVTGMTYGYANLTWVLPDLIGESQAKQVLLAGGAVDGTRADELGLLAELVADERVRDTAVALAARVAALPPGGVRAAKSLIRDGAGRDVRGRYDAENLLARQALSLRSADDVFAGFTERKRASDEH
ncbi:enoyl-CoA hydratase/isomerase family protein [Pseudonocardia spinosispora]|uniref:enoyl-CoA hydratase/isomerase family protein n=1 Tax=Pseudonocardia spinosispora TaxID=103441 RepID=UPI000429511C|nr:enoyl-CoA hydratase/isomerase family protein [Pseudonocardia spinosispora]